VVKECILKASQKKYAVKIMRNLDDERVLAGKNEYELLLRLDHPNIIKVKEFFVTDREIFMIMELIKGQELFERIAQIEKYDENIAKGIFK
jgi:serine/threonine protein kinase